MKPGPNLKQRSRGRNNNGGGKKHMPSRNQTYDSNGPDIRIRGNAHQVLEKYLTMARDASSQGDRVAAENYYQHAEHYFRVISAQNQANGIRPNDRPLPTPADDQMNMANDMDGDEDGDDEGNEEAVVEQVSHQRHQHHQQQTADHDEAPQHVQEHVAEHGQEQPAAEAAPPRRRRPPRDRNRDHEPRSEEPRGEPAEA